MAVEFNTASTVGAQAKTTFDLYNQLAGATDPVEISKLSAMVGLQSQALESMRKAHEESARALVGKA